MATNRKREQKEFRDTMNAFQKSFSQLMEGPCAAVTFWKNYHDPSVIDLVSSDGTLGSMSLDAFEVTREHLGGSCLICMGRLGIKFDMERKPILFLVCTRCERVHTAAAGDLCLKDS